MKIIAAIRNCCETTYVPRRLVTIARSVGGETFMLRTDCSIKSMYAALEQVERWVDDSAFPFASADADWMVSALASDVREAVR